MICRNSLNSSMFSGFFKISGSKIFLKVFFSNNKIKIRHFFWFVTVSFGQWQIEVGNHEFWIIPINCFFSFYIFVSKMYQFPQIFFYKTTILNRSEANLCLVENISLILIFDVLLKTTTTLSWSCLTVIWSISSTISSFK